MASVAALTFLVARAVPLGWTVAVAAGVPLARAGERHGTRAGYATAAASLVETTAIMGPARMGIPVPHAASAPLLGALYRREASFLALAAAGAAVRTVYYVATAAFSIVVLIGLDAYLGAYERLRDLLGLLPAGRTAALWLTFAQLVAWSVGAGLIQAWTIRRGLRRWDAAVGSVEEASTAKAPAREAPPSRAAAIVLAGLVGFAAALASTNPRILAGLAVVLLLAWAATAASGRALVRGLVLAMPLALSTLGFGLVGGIGAELAARRAGRVALLVLIAVWVRSAAGAEGLRRVLVSVVGRLRGVPLLATTASVLAGSTQADDLEGAARRLGARLRPVRRPAPAVDAALGWLAEESTRMGAPGPPAQRPES